MKARVFVAASLILAAAVGPTFVTGASAAAPANTAAQPPHYEWQYGYERGGKWRGHWILVR